MASIADSQKEEAMLLASCLISCHYLDRKLVHHQILTLLQNFPSLTPSMEPYVHNDGSTEKLINVRGTFPIQFNGKQYNIPLAIWILRDYPQSIPLIYLLPTPEMRIRAFKYVNRNGQVKIPVTPPIRFTLSTLANFLRTIFEESPPLYVKKRSRDFLATET